MTRLEEIYKECEELRPFPTGMPTVMPDYIIEIARSYAVECVKASLERAAKRAKIRRIDYITGEERTYHSCACEGKTDYADKQSITSEDNIILL